MRAIVLAAGEGRRTRPLTHGRPKVMLPVGNRPILEHVIRALHVAGVLDVTLVVRYKAESIQTHFGDGSGFGVKIRYVRQAKAAGTADAFHRGLGAAPGDEPVLLIPGDNFMGREVLQRFLERAGERDALLYTTSQDPQRYGVVQLRDDLVHEVEEAPASPQGNLISTGILKVAARRAKAIKAFAADPQGLVRFLESLAQGKDRLLGVPVDGAWYDVDRPENLLGANALYLPEEDATLAGVIEPGASLVGAVRVGRGSRIRSGSYLVGPVVIGEGCEIGPHTVVYGPAALGDNVTVGPFTELLECVVMSDVRIASGCTLHHAVLDRGVVLAPRVAADRAHVVEGPSFGAVLGDGSRLGNNVIVEPGSVLGVDARVAPNKTVGALPDGARVV